MLQKFIQTDMVDSGRTRRLQQKDKIMHPNQKREVNYCATMIQKFIRGYLSRKRRPNIIYLLKFFKIVNRLNTKRTIQSLSKAFRQSHQMIKTRKQAILNGYITYCAIKIQKVYRAYKTRTFIIPMRKAFGHRLLDQLEAVAIGWVTRKIFKLKDV